MMVGSQRWAVCLFGRFLDALGAGVRTMIRADDRSAADRRAGRTACSPWRGPAAIAGLLAAAVGCTPPPPTSATSPGSDEQAVPPSGTAPSPGPEGAANAAALPGRTRVPSTKLVDRRASTALAADTLDQVKSAGRAPQSATEIYREVAPATVIIRTAEGLGSGVIIDAAGWVLTNHHVVAHGRAEDFVVTVSVLLGALSAQTGSMERQDREYEGRVYKADKLHDLALVKIVDPPKGLRWVPLARTKPSPGDHVVAIGHAGAGMLWAIKSGEISALGKLSEHLATLASFKDDPDGVRARDEFRKSLEQRNLGLVIQSTCKILPGDSGGPLVNTSGELVGVNAFSNRDNQSGGLLSFHVHLSEIRGFAAPFPARPIPMLPDPWEEGGGDSSFEDGDLDGRVDMFVLQGRSPCSFCPRQSSAVFMDVDQDSYRTGPLPPLEQVFKNRTFDAEVVFLQLEEDSYVWYDADRDGVFERLLVDERSTGLVSAGYRIEAGGALVRDPTLSTGKLFRPTLFADPQSQSRLARIAQGVFPERYTEGASTVGESLPAPMGAFGQGSFRDLSDDGRADSIELDLAFSQRLLVDLDQNTIPALAPSFDASKAYQRDRVDAELVAVSQGTHMWAWYDTDDDGRFDLALHSPETRLYVATEAWAVDPTGTKRPAPEHVGRKLLRAGLFQSPALSASARAMVGGGMLAIMSAVDEGLGSFPDPIADHRGTGFEAVELPGAPRSVVMLLGRGSDGYLADLDGSSPLTTTDASAVETAVTKGRFNPEFAYFQRNGVAWTYYDTDGRGGYDCVLVCLDLTSGKAAVGYRIARDGHAVVDEALGGQPLVRPSLIVHPTMRARMKTIADSLFADAMREP